MPTSARYSAAAPSPTIPIAFSVPLSYLSGAKSGCTSSSDWLPVPPRISGSTSTPGER